jgi:hypothetical protein
MKTRFFCSMAATIVSIGSGVFGSATDPAALVRDAVSTDPAVAAAAAASLRAEGPAGLEALFAAHDAEIRTRLATPSLGAPDEAKWRRLCAALDAVGQQRDDFASRLYWYTDLDAAKAAARASGKPILSLRLLGKLDEEFSCANSRFFRTVLYADAAISRRLREHFVLHWESVRPAPKVTIDFGDGRKLERTITGNSVHYILDADGGVIDAIPGLYGPKAFLAALDQAESADGKYAQLAPEERAAFLRAYHGGLLRADAARWNQDLLKIGMLMVPGPTTPLSGRPAAAVADRRTINKSAIERPIVVAIAPTRETPARDVDAAGWEKIAGLHADEAVLDKNSIALIEIKDQAGPGPLATVGAKCPGEVALAKKLSNLNRLVAEDAVRNEYLFHAAIHQWFAEGAAPGDLRQLNDKVYAELFLTPASDPWLGLKPADTYSALDHDGIAGGGLTQAGR